MGRSLFANTMCVKNSKQVLDMIANLIRMYSTVTAGSSAYHAYTIHDSDLYEGKMKEETQGRPW